MNYIPELKIIHKELNSGNSFLLDTYKIPLHVVKNYFGFLGKDLLYKDLKDGAYLIHYSNSNFMNNIQIEPTYTGVITSPQGWNYTYVYTLKS